MNKLAIVVVLASGCHLVDSLKGPPPKAASAENPLRPDAHAELVEGSFQFVKEREGLKLNVEYWDNVPEAWSASAVSAQLSGPNGVRNMSWMQGVPWDASWPAGRYKLAIFAFGKNIGERELTVATPPTGFGDRSPTIVSDERHVVSLQDGRLYTYLPVNVATPRYVVQFIWIKDHRVVHTGWQAMNSPSLIDMSQLGEYARVDISTKAVSDVGSATLLVFVNGTGLYGAWSWTKDQQVRALSLPPAKLAPSDLAIARVAARQTAAEYVVHSELLGGSHAEALACGVATDEKVRDVFAGYRHQAFDNNDDADQANEKLDRADSDDALTDRQRARLRSEGEAHRAWAAEDAKSGAAALAQAIQLSRKYKKGCLAAMGVPTLPVLATR